MNALQKRLLGRAGFAIVLNAILVWILSMIAPRTDYQYAFLSMVVVTLITILVVLLLLHWVARISHRRWLVPGVTALIVFACSAIFRMESLSGEMVPKIVWRWTSHEVPQRRQQPVIVQPSTPPSPVDVEVPAESASEDNLVAAWPGFLGPDRDGSIDQRRFEIPEVPSQVNRIWDIGVGSGWSSFAVGQDAAGTSIAVTMEQRDANECVTAYRLSDGELLWLVDRETYHFHPLGGDGPRSTPAIDGGRVYAQGATGFLWCLDLATGKEIWTQDLVELGGWTQVESEVAILWGRSGSPLILGDLCVLPLGGPAASNPEEKQPQRSLVALDKTTGEIRWRGGEDQISYASPQVMTIDGQQQIVIVNEVTITSHDPTTGNVLWTYPWIGQSNGGANCTATVPTADDEFLIGKGYGGGSALVKVRHGESSKWSTETLWQSSRVLKTKFNHAVIRDGVAYGLSNGTLEAVDVAKGERLWEQPRRERSGQGQVLLADDVLVVQNESGELLFVEANPEAYVVRCQIEALQQKTWNIPTLVDNLLLVRNAEQAIAFELPERQ